MSRLGVIEFWIKNIPSINNRRKEYNHSHLSKVKKHMTSKPLSFQAIPTSPSDLTNENVTNQNSASLITHDLHVLKTSISELNQSIKEIISIQSPLVGIEQMAKYFGKSQDTIRRWVKDRTISCYKIPNSNGHSLLFSWKQLEDDLADYLQERL